MSKESGSEVPAAGQGPTKVVAPEDRQADQKLVNASLEGRLVDALRLGKGDESASLVISGEDRKRILELLEGVEGKAAAVFKENVRLRKGNANFKEFIRANLLADEIGAGRDVAEFRLRIARFAHECGWQEVAVNQLKKASGTMESYVSELERDNDSETDNMTECLNQARIDGSRHRMDEISRILDLVKTGKPVDWTSYGVAELGQRAWPNARTRS